jgi:hypothetical protein
MNCLNMKIRSVVCWHLPHLISAQLNFFRKNGYFFPSFRRGPYLFTAIRLYNTMKWENDFKCFETNWYLSWNIKTIQLHLIVIRAESCPTSFMMLTFFFLLKKSLICDPIFPLIVHYYFVNLRMTQIPF